MAQYNSVHLYAMVKVDPKVVRDDSTGAVKRATMVLTCSSSPRQTGDRAEDNIVSFDDVLVLSRIPEMGQRMAQARANDIVLLKGTLNTRDAPKQAICEECGQKFIVNEMKQAENDGDDSKNTSMITFVTPIEFDIIRTGLSQDDALKDLIAHREISNEVQVIGNLCADPKSWSNGKVTSYQLGITRKYFLPDDNPNIVADYPYVRVYGQQALNDIEALSKSSLVFIDGCLKLRRFPRISTCPNCGAQKKWTDRVMEIVPFVNAVEYLDGYKTGLQRAAAKQQELEEQPEQQQPQEQQQPEQNPNENQKTITYTFNANGGKWTDNKTEITVTGKTGDAVSLPENPVYTTTNYDYKFTGWNTTVPQTFGEENLSFQAQ